MFCSCDIPLPERATATCHKCGRACVAALQPTVVRIDPLDRLLKYRRAVAYQAQNN